MTLRELDKARAMYVVPRQDLVNEVMIPAMKNSVELTCMFGYFDSSSFAHLAPGLAAFLNTHDGTFRLIISPQLNLADQDALKDAVDDPETVLQRVAEVLFEDGRISESALVRHNLACLSYLLATGRLELRFAVMKGGGLFHPKVWIFRDDFEYAVAQGSSNFTTPGLVFNYETVTLERPWRGPDPAEKAADCLAMFDRLWSGGDEDAIVIAATEAIRYGLLTSEASPMPTLDDFWTAWRADAALGLAPPLPRGVDDEEPALIRSAPAELVLPPGLNIDTGDFAHQLHAVEAWEGAGGRGILAMATGSGKTITALVCATRLQERNEKLLVVVAAPYRPLIAQWEDEVRAFLVEPVPLAVLSGVQRDDRFQRAVDSLLLGVSRTEVLVITHDYLTSTGFKHQLEKVPDEIRTMLVADEAHNLGRRSFISDPPERFEYRLGLSATPERQYDPDGTAALFSYMGSPVFQFTLAEAIARHSLVPYRYFLHPVELDEDEFDEWKQLTERLRKLGFGAAMDSDDSGEMSTEVKALVMKRRAVIEMARSKIAALRSTLAERSTRKIRHTLIYTSDKGEAQLQAVNALLGADLGIVFHQLTAEETSSRRKTQQILGDFAAGRYQIITCKRVLDEGVNIPQVAEAYLLASNTVRRQWIQRRGRILRRCDAIGKSVADLHDFLVLPPDPDDPGARVVARQELTRAHEFAALAQNAGGADDPFVQIADIGRRFGAPT